MSQARVLEALAVPAAYPHAAPSVTICRTHISEVFLAGDWAYKVKRAQRTSFLDFRTLEQRRHACREELRVNADWAPDVYRAVVPINGAGRIGGPGQPVEFAVAMRRLPAARMLDAVLAADGVTDEDIDAIADHLVAAHRRAPRVTPAPLPQKIDGSLAWIESYAPPLWFRHWVKYNRAFVAGGQALLDERAPLAIDGHGDLHAGNVCLAPEGVVFYDRIEFEPRFREADPLADLSFLVMDLQAHGAWRRAERLVARYGAGTGAAHTDQGALLAYLVRHRATVRGGAAAMRGSDGLPYFRFATQVGLAPFTVMLCGLPGTGKSHAARALARAWDADILRSDLIRKEIWGMAPTDHWEGAYDEGPYAPEVTARTHAMLAEREKKARARGRRVVLDATFDRAATRALFPDAFLVWITCADDVVRARITARQSDKDAVSDADWSVYQIRKANFEPPATSLLRHDGSASPNQIIDAVLDHLTSPARSR